MPEDWVKLGTGAVAGGAAGAVDQVIQNRDDKEEDRRHKLTTTDPAYLKPDAKLPMMSRFGTYYNYGAPLAGVAAVAMGALKGDTALMALTAGGQLAGRQLTHSMTVKARPIVAGYSVWQRAGGGPAPPLSPPGTGSRLEF
jgi:hypothetical protein